MAITATQQRDANRQVIHGYLPFLAKKEIVFAGETENAIGDDAGTNALATVFTVTGHVMFWTIGIVSTEMVGDVGAVFSFGVLSPDVAETGCFQNLLAAESIPAGSVFDSQDPATQLGRLPVLSANSYYITSGNNIIIEVTNASINSGSISFYCFWMPLSDGASVVPA